MGEWKNCSVGDLGAVITGKTPSTRQSNYWNGSTMFVTPKDIQGVKHIRTTERNITDSGLHSVNSSLLSPNAICVSCIGNIGYVAMTTQECISNQQINSIIVNKDNDPDFVYYLMKNLWTFFKNYEGQSTALSILNKTQFSKIEVRLPASLEEQKQIASVLSALDDKIEENTELNKNLEEQAQTIFNAWFIDLIPFNRAMPSDWTTTRLGDICVCELGGTPSRNKQEYWNGDIPWVNSGEVNQFRIIKPSEYITALGLSKSATKLLPSKTTVLAITGATLGQVSLLEISSCANQSVVGVLPNEILPYEFIYPFIKANINELLSHQTGGAQQHINKQNVEALNIVLPSSDVIKKYTSVVSPLYSSIANNCFANDRLSEIRDILLPKLMSGELDVSTLDL